MAGVGDVLSLVRTIQQTSQDVSASKKLVKLSSEKLITIIPLLSSLEMDNSFSRDHSATTSNILDQVKNDLLNVQKIVAKVKQMNKVVYVIKASQIHDDLQSLLNHIHFSLASLGVQQNATLQKQLASFEDKWTQRDNELERTRLHEQKSLKNLLKGDLKTNVAAITNHNQDEMKRARQALREEQDELRTTLLELNDSVRQSKLEQEQQYLDQIISALQVAAGPKATEAPAWAVCPITLEVMTDPVTVDSPCQHTFSRHAIKKWMNQRKMTCPECSASLRSSILSPNSHLRDAIADLDPTISVSDIEQGGNEKKTLPPKDSPDTEASQKSPAVAKINTTEIVANLSTNANNEANSAVGGFSKKKWLCIGAVIVAVVIGVVVGVMVAGGSPKPDSAPSASQAGLDDQPPITSRAIVAEEPATSTENPSTNASAKPTVSPSGVAAPAHEPTRSPTKGPAKDSTGLPTDDPAPTVSPSGIAAPTHEPTRSPAKEPTKDSTGSPTEEPTPVTYSHSNSGFGEPTQAPNFVEPAQAPNFFWPTSNNLMHPTSCIQRVEAERADDQALVGPPTGFANGQVTAFGRNILVNETRLEAVEVANTFSVLSGTMPTELGLLTALTSFSASCTGPLDSRDQVWGTLPSELGLLTALTYMALSNCDVGGTIPSELGLMTQTRSLSIIENLKLAGTIPSELGLLTAMTRLNLVTGANFNLGGTVPSALCSLAELSLTDCTVGPNVTVPQGCACNKAICLRQIGDFGARICCYDL